MSSFELDGVVTVRGEPRPQLIPMIIGAADVCIASAAATPRYQDFGDVPQPLLEHIACRRPVVAAGVPGVAEVLRDDKEVLLYPPSDQDTLAESILALVEQPTLRARLIEAAYDRVRWQFSDGARRRRIAEVYEMLVPGSQLYDSWIEGFERDVTGSLDVASTGVAERLAERAAPLPDGAAIVFGPEQDPAPARDDTSPGAEIADVDDLADVPTEIARAKTDVSGRPDTDQTGAPDRSDPDTGPVPAPD